MFKPSQGRANTISIPNKHFTIVECMNPENFVKPAPGPRRGVNLLVAGLLGAFVTTTYFSVIRRVSSDDLEKEFERELFEEYKKQEETSRGGRRT